MDADDRDFARYRATGDPAALAALFDRLAPKLLLLAAHWTRDAATAEDLVQVVFVQALRDAAQWDPRQPLGAWLAGILAHRALDLHKHAARRRHSPLDADAAEELAASGPTPLAAAIDREAAERVAVSIDALAQPYRDVLVLRLLHGLEPGAIAHALGRPPATVRKQLERGLSQLRAALPATLAVLLAGLCTAGRGLAAVRQAVLAAAQPGWPVATAVATGGVLIMQKVWFAAAAAVVLAAVLWWSIAGAAPPAAKPNAGAAPPAPAVAAAPATSPAAAPEPQREAVPTPAAPVVAAAIEVLVVEDGTGEPVAGIGIELLPQDGRDEALQARRASTDAHGIAAFEGLASGPHRATVDLGRGDVADDVAAVSGQRTRLVLRLPQLLDVAGTVVDADGHPVAGARVLRYRRTGIHWDYPPHLAAISDADGRFALRTVPGTLLLQARDDAHAPSPVYQFRTEQLPAVIALQLGGAPASLRGLVTADGRPVAGARMQLHRGLAAQRPIQGGIAHAHASTFADTAADGSFALSGLLPGKADLRVVAAGWAPAQVDVELQAGSCSEVQVVLTLAARLAGRVVDQDGGPLGGARIWCCSRTTHSAADGGFHLDDLPAGAAKATATDLDGYCGRSLEVQLDAGAEARCELRLERLPLLKGRVVDAAGRGLAGFAIAAVREDLGRNVQQSVVDGQGRLDVMVDQRGRQSGLAARTAQSDGDGRFVLAVMPEVDYLLDLCQQGQFHRVYGDAFGSFRAPRDDVVLTVQPADIADAFVTGRLLGADGAPVRDAWFQLGDGERLGTVGHNMPGTARTGDDGRFRLGPVPARSYVLKVHPGRGGATMPPIERKVELASGQELDLGDLHAGATAQLSVRLRRSDGGVFEGALLGLDRSEGGGDQYFPFDKDGKLEQAVVPGSYTMVVHGQDVPTKRQQLVLAAGERKQLEFTLPRGIHFGLRIRLPAGETGGKVALLDGDGDPTPLWDSSDELMPGKGPGEKRFACLAPGPHTAELVCSSSRRYTAVFTVREQPGSEPEPCELVWQPAQ